IFFRKEFWHDKAFYSADRKEFHRDRFLPQGVDESSRHDQHGVDLLFQEQVSCAGGDGFGFHIARGIAVVEFGKKAATSASDELSGTASGGDEKGGLGIKLRGDSKKVAVKRTAQAFVTGHEDDPAFAHFTDFEKGMGEIGGLGRGFA